MIVFDPLDRPVFGLAKKFRTRGKDIYYSNSITMQFHISLENFKLAFTAGWTVRGLDMRVTHKTQFIE